MDITLHIGAHRTGTTTFQQYLRDTLAADDTGALGFWGPMRTRKGLFAGLFPGKPAVAGKNLRRRAEGRVQIQLDLARRAGVRHLLVSDENMIGSPVGCVRGQCLYPAIGERMARVSAAFGGNIGRVVINIRAQDLWWASTFAHIVARGHAVPGAGIRDGIAQGRRSWRDVITDLACAVPEAEILVVPFEQTVARPDTLRVLCTGTATPRDLRNLWLNRSADLPTLRALLIERGEDASRLPDGTGRWQPFSTEQTAMMRENYADDLHWLVAGADGLATLTKDETRKSAGTSQPSGQLTRGQENDHTQGRMAHSG